MSKVMLNNCVLKTMLIPSWSGCTSVPRSFPDLQGSHLIGARLEPRQNPGRHDQPSLVVILLVTKSLFGGFDRDAKMKPATLRPFLSQPAIRRWMCPSRSYAVQAPGSPTLQVFNRHTKYQQKERAAANVERSRQVDYLKDEVAMRLSERLLVSFK